MKFLAGQSRMFWIITGAALALRLVHLWFMRANPLFDQPVMDAAVHDAWARGLLAGTWPGPEPFFRAPLYIYFLAGLYALFDAARFPVQVVHVVVSALAPALAALSADRLWGRRAGYMAGCLLAALWTHIYFSAELLIVTLSVTLNLLWLWLLLREQTPSSPRRLFLVGLVLGLSAVARPNILIVVPVVAWFVWRGLRARPAGWLLLAAGLVLPIASVTVSNLVRSGDAVLIASQGGVNFFIGNNPDSDGRTAIVPGTRPTWQGGYADAVALAERAEGRTLKASEVDRHYLGRGLSFWADDPGTALGLYGHKLRMLLGAGERSNNKFIYAWREWSPLLMVPVLVGWPALLCLAVLGWSRRDGNAPARVLLLGAAAAYACSILLFFVNARFRLPVAAILAIPAGAGLDALWTALRQRRWELGWVAPVLAAGLLAFSLSDFRDFREHRTEANSFYRFTLGNAYLTRGDTGPAIAAYREALAIQRRTPNPRFDLV
ncbi:glycosyltransferase family 39 protein, partial [bacterium]|nr:glycosyltransferase family 39 protein [bacterium]